MPKPNFSILLAPAQRKATGGNPFAPDMFDYRSSSTFNFFKELNEKRRALIDELQKTIRESDDLEGLFNIQGSYLEDAVEANQNLYDAPLMSAFDRYSPGTMYQAIDFENLPTGAQRRLLENGVIFSGLFGLLRPDDLIPRYRLRMEDELPGFGRVYKYWRPHVSPLLNRTLEGRWVWNLLPRTQERVWNDEHTYERMLTVKFYKETAVGERTPVTHAVKELRGSLISFIVENTIEDMEDFREWEHPEGYVLDEETTTLDEETKTSELIMVQRKGWEKRRRVRKERERKEREREEREKRRRAANDT